MYSRATGFVFSLGCLQGKCEVVFQVKHAVTIFCFSLHCFVFFITVSHALVLFRSVVGGGKCEGFFGFCRLSCGMVFFFFPHTSGLRIIPFAHQLSWRSLGQHLATLFFFFFE